MQKIKNDSKLFILFILAVGLFGVSIGVTVSMPFSAAYIFVIITLILLGYLLYRIIMEEPPKEGE